MSRFDITETNIAVERLIETTENPRHLYLLQAYNRHRNLEMAGRYEEIFAPEMTVDEPVYHFNMLGKSFTLDGAEEVQAVYREWTRHGSVRLLHRGREARRQRRHDRLDVRSYQQTLGIRPRRRGCPRRPRRHVLSEVRRAHDLALRRQRPLDRRGRLGVRRFGPRVHPARPDRRRSPSSRPASCSTR